MNNNFSKQEKNKTKTNKQKKIVDNQKLCQGLLSETGFAVVKQSYPNVRKKL